MDPGLLSRAAERGPDQPAQRRADLVEADTSVDERHAELLQTRHDVLLAGAAVHGQEDDVGVPQLLDVGGVDVHGVGDDVPAQHVVPGLVVVHLLRPGPQLLQAHRAGGAEGVVGEHVVPVVQVDLAHRGLGQGVEDVGAGAADSDDHDLERTQTIGHRADPGAASSGVQVAEHRLLVLVRDRRVGGGRGGRIDHLRVGLQHRGVRAQLVVVVRVGGIGLVGEGTAGRQPVGQVKPAPLIDQVVEDPALVVARQVVHRGTAEVDHMRARGGGDVASQGQLGDQRAPRHHPAGRHVRDAHHQVVGADLDVVPLLPQTEQVRATTD